ncbi:MAG TPA: kelch repeat-containing protein [Anaerolineae bacterium]|nr:kelch repeat-containing protein [Anaerolineae bacterium]
MACMPSPAATPPATSTPAPTAAAREVVTLESPTAALPTLALTPTPAPDRGIRGPAPAHAVWTMGKPMIPPYRSEMPAVVLDGMIYVPGGFGGESRLDRYDPAADEWEALAGMPDGRHHLMAAAHGGYLYVFGGSTAGGFNPTNTVWRYDPAANAWSELGSMPERRMSGAAVTIGDKVYVAGGMGDSDSLLEFTPDTGEWRILSGGLHPRDHANAVAFEGKIWPIGGRGAGGETNAVEIFDPATETWSAGPPLNIARAGFAAAVVDGRIMVAGGEVIVSGRETLGSLEIFEPGDNAWRPGPDTLQPIHGVGGASISGRFYLLGGSSEAAGIANSGMVQIYLP